MQRCTIIFHFCTYGCRLSKPRRGWSGLEAGCDVQYTQRRSRRFAQLTSFLSRASILKNEHAIGCSCVHFATAVPRLHSHVSVSRFVHACFYRTPCWLLNVRSDVVAFFLPQLHRAYVSRKAFTFFRRVSNLRSCAAVCLRHSCAAHMSPVRCATVHYHFPFLYIWM